MYYVTLYCSNDECLALFEAEGTLEAIEAAHCPYCCCCLGELSFAPVQGAGGPPGGDLELWTIHEPLGEVVGIARLIDRRGRKGRRGKGRRASARRLRAA
jgi:hypothetical protein